MEYNYFDTVAGHIFTEMTLPRLTESIETLNETVSKIEKIVEEQSKKDKFREFCTQEAGYRLSELGIIQEPWLLKTVSEALYEASELIINSDAVVDVVSKSLQDCGIYVSEKERRKK